MVGLYVGIQDCPNQTLRAKSLDPLSLHRLGPRVEKNGYRENPRFGTPG